MNLYQLHDNPESLHNHKEADMHVTELFWIKYRNDPAELKKREDAISRDAMFAYMYASNVLNGPFPKGEDAISKDAHYAYAYAKNVLNKPWPKGEAVIRATAPYYVALYLDKFPERKEALEKLHGAA